MVCMLVVYLLFAQVAVASFGVVLAVGLSLTPGLRNCRAQLLSAAAGCAVGGLGGAGAWFLAMLVATLVCDAAQAAHWRACGAASAIPGPWIGRAFLGLYAVGSCIGIVC